MKHFLFVIFIFATMAFSGCHKLGKKKCADCPKWNKIEIQKKGLLRL